MAKHGKKKKAQSPEEKAHVRRNKSQAGREAVERSLNRKERGPIDSWTPKEKQFWQLRFQLRQLGSSRRLSPQQFKLQDQMDALVPQIGLERQQQEIQTPKNIDFTPTDAATGKPIPAPSFAPSLAAPGRPQAEAPRSFGVLTPRLIDPTAEFRTGGPARNVQVRGAEAVAPAPAAIPAPSFDQAGVEAAGTIPLQGSQAGLSTALADDAVLNINTSEFPTLTFPPPSEQQALAPDPNTINTTSPFEFNRQQVTSLTEGAQQVSRQGTSVFLPSGAQAPEQQQIQHAEKPPNISKYMKSVVEDAEDLAVNDSGITRVNGQMFIDGKPLTSLADIRQSTPPGAPIREMILGPGNKSFVITETGSGLNTNAVPDPTLAGLPGSDSLGSFDDQTVEGSGPLDLLKRAKNALTYPGFRQNLALALAAVGKGLSAPGTPGDTLGDLAINLVRNKQFRSVMEATLKNPENPDLSGISTSGLSPQDQLSASEAGQKFQLNKSLIDQRGSVGRNQDAQALRALQPLAKTYTVEEFDGKKFAVNRADPNDMVELGRDNQNDFQAITTTLPDGSEETVYIRKDTFGNTIDQAGGSITVATKAVPNADVSDTPRENSAKQDLASIFATRASELDPASQNLRDLSKELAFLRGTQSPAQAFEQVIDTIFRAASDNPDIAEKANLMIKTMRTALNEALRLAGADIARTGATTQSMIGYNAIALDAIAKRGNIPTEQSILLQQLIPGRTVSAEEFVAQYGLSSGHHDVASDPAFFEELRRLYPEHSDTESLDID